jgi:hypothetical protein
MLVFRWVVAGLAALLALGSILCFALFMMVGIEVWIKRTRWLRRAVFAVIMIWFNVEVWGKVLYTIMHWSR